MQSRIQLKTVWHRTDEQLATAALNSPHPVIVLDVVGKAISSPEFGELLYESLETGGSRTSFVIGGAEGLPPALLAGTGGKVGQMPRISLSKMTFTHQMARALLAEQVYRAAEMRRGSGYHK